MASRLDRLVQLLDTGASPAVRQAAAKQIANIATKCLRTDSGIEGDINSIKPDATTSQERLEDWSEVISVAAKILPLLRSKNTETRNAAATTISYICSLAPLWTPLKPATDYDHDPIDFPPFSVEQLLENGNLLLSSSGQEFSKPVTFGTPAELERARKEAKSRLGLDFLDAGDDDLDNGWTQELMEEATDVRMNENNHEQVVSPDSKMDAASPGTDEVGSPMSTDAPAHFARPGPLSRQSQQGSSIDNSESSGIKGTENDAALSAREKNRLKRKRRHQAGGGAFISPAAAAPPSKIRVVEQEGRPIAKRHSSSPPPDEESKVVIDPQAGGQVDAKEKAQHKVLEAKPGQWVWAGLTKVLSVDLFNANWEIRHGTCMALREIIKTQGASAGMHYHSSSEENAIHHEKWCNDMAAKLLSVFVLDRFGDFVADQVMAPVRESATQALAALLTHTPVACVQHVHKNLLDMIRQDFPKNEKYQAKIAYVWQVRHAGLLGLKYEVAVREDLIEKDESRGILRGVVEAAILGLADNDDDVRSVAAGCLLPVTRQIVEYLSGDLPQLLDSLWSCFDSMKDDLGSSVGAVMDLLGLLVASPRVLEVIGDTDQSRSLNQLAPLLFPFFRHTISSVRVAVVRTLHDFILVKELPMEWITTSFLRLLFQNVLLEEREEVRSLSLKTWNLALQRAVTDANAIHKLIPITVFRDWIETCNTPIGDPIDPARLFILNYQDEMADAHNVDKIMMNQDLSLIDENIIWLARIACAQALAVLANLLPREAQQEYFEVPLKHYLNSPSYFHKFMGSTILQEWAMGYEKSSGNRLISHSNLCEDLSKVLLTSLSSEPPNCYHESFPLLDHMCKMANLQVNSFLPDPRFNTTSIQLPQNASIAGGPDVFAVSHVRQAIDWLDSLHNLLPKPKKKRDVNRIDESKRILRELLHSFEKAKAVEDARVAAAFAAAAIALKTMPPKLTPLIKGVMNGLREEENTDLQDRSAIALASFIHFSVLDTSSSFQGPVDKVIKNLCVFLCQDDNHTPLFAKYTSKELGILSFNKAVASAISRAPMRLREEPADEPKEITLSRVMRRGGTAAFSHLATQFGPALFDRVPKVWQCASECLCTVYPPGSTVEVGDRSLEADAGQPFLDTLTALRDILRTLDTTLFSRVEELFPSLLLGLQSRFAVIRQAVAKCFAVICEVMTNTAMLFVIERVLPLVDDAKVVRNRQGAVELVFHVVNTLQFKILPYIIFLIVPLLGRMSDPDEDVRSAATNSFATLVKMVPLEAGLPDPPGFPEELLNKRDKERVFLAQLFDGSKVESYTVPVQINAELRKYQQDGVNWLAFLSKYQLHGILCDDMGLGKTLQSICILASRHHERAQRKELHLPSFIICPPTLTSHWHHEIKKYAPTLRPVTYTGPIKDRKITLKRIPQYDVVITSYDVVRNDFAQLSGLSWLYCILDEGHLIKNSKSKVSVAVKSIKAHHRLILSGTPIQNNLLELWSLFDFLMPGFLGNETSFNERFARPVLASKDGKAGAKGAEAAAQALEALHKQVLPFLLRRMKENVLDDLPPKIIQDYYCDVSPLQELLFDEFQNSRVSAEAESSVKTGNVKGHVFQALQYLRKVCNHPALVLKDDQPETGALLSKVEEHSAGSKSIRDVQHAPKLLALKQLLQDCGIGVAGKDPDAAEDPLADVETAPPQHRCLIFCQMKMMINVIETDLFQQLMPSVTYMRLDGTIDAQKRHAIVQTFNDDPSIDCLLLTTHIGGLGLTLTGADTVIFVEHDWNPMKDLQAMDRAHRLGQKRVVNVYRLITKGTLEEKIMGLQRFKLNIANSVVTQQNAGLDSMDTDLVLDLFRRTTDEEDAAAAAKKAGQASNGPVSQKNILEGLEDLHGEDEYAGLDLQSFMSSLGR